MKPTVDWLALMIGNSRLHWAWFTGKTLYQIWDSPHLSSSLNLGQLSGLKIPVPLRDNWGQYPLYIASVVPTQSAFFQGYPQVKTITLEQLPLQGMYPTLGIDRALAVWGMGENWGFPSLVIDAGTALTFTGVDQQQTLIGGAILPGLKLQFQMLSTQTAALPSLSLPNQIPVRWAVETVSAIESGIIHTILAGIESFIQDWWQKFPESPIALTGGDGKIIWQYLKIQSPQIGQKLKFDGNLIFWGMRSVILGID